MSKYGKTEEQKNKMMKGSKNALNNQNYSLSSAYSNINKSQAVGSNNYKLSPKKNKDLKQTNNPLSLDKKSSQKSSSDNESLKKKEESEKGKENDTSKSKPKDKDKENSNNTNDNNKILNNINNINNNNIQDELIGSDDKDLKATREPRDSTPFGNITKKENTYEFYINNSKKNVEELEFKCNHISTTKYNFITFLPKALLFQFVRIANVYFVFMAVIQCIPAISPLGAGTAIAPIVFVFTVSLIREAVEDLQRRKLDKEQNSDVIKTFRDGCWKKVQSGELQMGEVIQVYKDDIFPADLLLIDSNLPDGNCFIETGTLDGEKTLKIKSAPIFTKGKFSSPQNNEEKTNIQNNGVKRDSNKLSAIDNSSMKINGLDCGIDAKKKTENKKKINDLTSQKSEVHLLEGQKLNSNYLNNPNVNMNYNIIKDNLINDNDNENNENLENENENTNINLFTIDGIIQCDQPNPFLYSLNGKASIRLNGEVNTFGLDAKNLLLKGAKLRNTDWVIGIIIYTGHSCKLMKNAKEPLIKMSSIEKMLNRLLVFIFIVQVALSIASSVLHSIFYSNHSQNIIKSKRISIGESEESFWIDYLTFHSSIDSLLSFFTYLLLLNTLIPISLIITLELVKIVQGIFMSFDVQTYSSVRKKFVKTNSVSLNEELGAVDYIFSDKTGTLTSNKMNLKFCVIGEQCFEYIRNGLASDEFKINKQLRENEDIIPFEDYDMIKTSGMKIAGSESTTNNSNNINTNNNNHFKNNNKDKKNLLPIVTYNNYNVKTKNNEICISFKTNQKLIEEYWKILSLCHDCSIQDGEYIGMSPDNIELVKSAKSQGFVYDVPKDNTELLLTFKNNQTCNSSTQQKYEKLCHIEFSSDRKRESILVKEGSVNKLYTKGADSVIEKLLDNSTPSSINENCRKFVNKFSEQGYRTLYIAMRVLTEKETQEFLSEYRIVQMETEKKKEKLDKLYEKIEKNLTLIGSTIVEDKLQQNVPEVIRELREADIKIWMLTGDKLSTAHNIGLSCNLINKDMKTFFIVGKEKKLDDNLKVINLSEQEEVIINFIKEYHGFLGSFEQGYLEEKNLSQKFGILVDEKALVTIIENPNIEKMFLDVAKEAVAVICCRVSPLQKSQVVKMMKNYDKSKITLAIGDGGNDVSMIMEAHIGIGIYGEEGLRAAQSSDFAIGEFQVLKRLLFFHGYLNMMRNSIMIIYFFYKNFVFTIVHFFYGFMNDFSGQTIIDDWFITLYNLIFTSIPLAGRGILDISLRPEDGKIVEILMPYLYKEQREYPIFTIWNFILNLVKGAAHSSINYFFTIYAIKASISGEGHESNLWVMSVSMYTNILIIVTFDLIIFTKYHTLINWVLIIFFTIFLYAIFLVAVQRMTMFNSVGTMDVAFNSLLIWMNAIYVCGLCGLIDYITLSIKTFFVNSISHKVELVSQKNNLKRNYVYGLPEDLSQKIFDNLPFYEEKINSNKENIMEAAQLNNIDNNNNENNNEINNENDNDNTSIRRSKGNSGSILEDGKKLIPNDIRDDEKEDKIISIKINKENNKNKRTESIYNNKFNDLMNDSKINSNINMSNHKNKNEEDKKKKDDITNKIHHQADKLQKPKQAGGINFNSNHNKIFFKDDNSNDNKRVKKKCSCESTERRLINSILPQKI